MKKIVLFFGFIFLLSPLFSQKLVKNLSDKDFLKKEWEKVKEKGKLPNLSREDRKDPKKVSEWLKKRKEAYEKVKKAAEEFLKKFEKKLSKGYGLFYKGLALQTLGKKKDAYLAFQKFRKESDDDEMKLDAGINCLYILYYMNKYDDAKTLLEKLVKEDKTGKYSRTLKALESRFKGRSYNMWKKREALIGKDLPNIPVLKVIGADKFDWKNLKGKVILIDFWATWCGPCRVVIPHLVELQEKYGKDGLQVVGVTSFYGFGWKLEKREGDILIGKWAGRGLSKDQEIELNKIFHDKVPLNYPIIITERGVSSKKFGVTGIPTVYLVDRKGKIRWYKVGSGDEESLDEMVKKLLKEK